MTRKTKKFLVFLLTFLIILVYYCNFFEVFSNVETRFSGSDKGQGFSKSIINMILPAVRVVAAGVAIISITIMGTRYMAAAPAERAEIKNQIITFVAGILLVTGAVEITRAIIEATKI